MKERVLTVRELNRALLARQLLLERKKLSVVAALERVGPLHAQGVESTYVNLWSRIEGFRREQLTLALRRGTVIRSRPLRSTLHLVSARDYPLLPRRDPRTARRVVAADDETPLRRRDRRPSRTDPHEDGIEPAAVRRPRRGGGR
jgi:hypothetical protein